MCTGASSHHHGDGQILFVCINKSPPHTHTMFTNLCKIDIVCLLLLSKRVKALSLLLITATSTCEYLTHHSITEYCCCASK